MRMFLFAALAACGLALPGIYGRVIVQAAEKSDQAQPAQHKADGQMRQLSEEEMIFESNKLSDLAVRNPQNEKLGTLDNLIVDAHTGQVLYGILDTGYFAKKIPVPWTAVRLEKSGRTFFLVVNKSKEDLKNAPTFESRRKADLVNQQWKDTVDKFFGVTTAARPLRSEEHRSMEKHENVHH